jgi:surfeit locus 1 family protein
VKRWPILPTILVALAVLTMAGLGIWQLQRKGQKEAMLARYAAAAGLAPVVWPVVPDAKALPLFRTSALMCVKVVGWQSVSGSNAAGEPGYAHIASCQTGGAEGPGAKVAVGWSARPENPAWTGGAVNGMIAPDKAQLIKLVAADKIDGLEILARPSPDQIPNNHLLYASAAAVIYVLALRKSLLFGG